MDSRPITSLSRLHGALADATRVRLMEELWGCRRSAKELADSLAVAPDRLYYHLGRLEDASLIEVAELRPAGRGRVERVYQPVSREPSAGSLDPKERGDVLEAILAATVLDLRATVRAQETGRKPFVTLTRSTIRASRRRLDEYADACRALTEELQRDPGRGRQVKARVLTTVIEIEGDSR